MAKVLRARTPFEVQRSEIGEFFDLHEKNPSLLFEPNEYIISAGPSRDWLYTGIRVPGNCIIKLTNALGSMDMGWGPDKWVAPSGKFVNGEVQRATDGFTYSGDQNSTFNAFCFVVAIGDPISSPVPSDPPPRRPGGCGRFGCPEFVRNKANFFGQNIKSVLVNTKVPNWGASVGDESVFWDIPANEGGFIYTAFNDTDNNNRGVFQQTLKILPKTVFFTSLDGLPLAH